MKTPGRATRVIPAAHFTWEAEDFDHVGEAANGTSAPGGNGGGLSSPRMRHQATLGFGDDGAAKKKSEKVKPARRRDTRCARCSYVTERIMTEYGRKIQIPMLLFIGAAQVFFFGMLWASVWRHEAEDPRDEERVSRYIEGFWAAWTFMSDGGTHAKVYYAEQRFLGGAITVFGIIYLAAVLAFIVDMVREKMDSMRVGKGQVHEKNHTVILHWTDRTIPLIQELCIANESEGGGVVVVLARESMETMTHELNTQLPKNMRLRTKIVCRYGNPAVVGDLIKVSADRAKAVVILASGRTADESDSTTLRCLLSIKSMGYKLSGHIVAEVRDVDNEPLLQLVGGKLIETFVSHDVLGRLMLMSVRQIGLANVYDSMLGFEGNEFYMKVWPELNGLRWSDVLERFPKAIPIGICTSAGIVHLAPSSDLLFCDGDQLIVIAEDSGSYKPEPPSRVEAGTLPPHHEPESKAEKVLICGWRRDIRDILKLLDRVVTPNSEVHTMTHSVLPSLRNQQLLDEGLNVNDLQHIQLIHQSGNTSSRRRLDALPLHEYTSCLIFADQSYEEDTMQADSHSLATLVLIRDIQGKRQTQVSSPITCEVLDSRTQRTISGQRQLSLMSDFVQSNKFVARILAMIAENRNVRVILNELLGATGAALLIVPSENYVYKDEHISFWAVAKRAQQRGACLIGYQEKRAGSQRKTTLNPTDKFKAISWTHYDLAIIAVNHPLDIDHTEDAPADERKSSVNLACSVEAFSAKVTSHGNTSQDIRLDMSDDQEAFAHEAAHETVIPDEGGICASADTAASAMVKMASQYCQMMTEEEKVRFGNSLGAFGSSIKNGIFPTSGWNSMSSGEPSELTPRES